MNTIAVENKLKEIYSNEYADFLINFFKDIADITIDGNDIIISAKKTLIETEQ